MGFVISIGSGKGGTGKTIVATSLAISLGEVQFLDCDVEEQNANIFLEADFFQKKEVSIPIPKIDFSKCNFCKRSKKILNWKKL